MRATILPTAIIILTKANRTAVSMIAKESIVTRVLPLTCYFYYPNNFNINAFKMQHFKGIDKKGVWLNEYSQSAILHAPHFRRVVNLYQSG